MGPSRVPLRVCSARGASEHPKGTQGAKGFPINRPATIKCVAFQQFESAYAWAAAYTSPVKHITAVGVKCSQTADFLYGSSHEY